MAFERSPGRALLLLALAALAVAGCRRTRTTHHAGPADDDIFTTDDFPGPPVQDANVADDRRAFSEGGYNGALAVVHNGDRGTRIVTYQIENATYAHYYDGESWTPGVALRHPDASPSAPVYKPCIVAFVNTADDDREAARSRDGDAVIFWQADDVDKDGPGPDGVNRCLFVSTFDATFASDPAANYGFDVNPATPGVFDARRLNIPDRAGEHVSAVGLVTDGLCGEARWSALDGAYRFGDATTGLVAFWHQLEEKSPGILDGVTEIAAFDLAAPGDPAAPLPFSAPTQLDPVLFGASDAGPTCRESVDGDEYASYNGFLFRRVRTLAGSSLLNGFTGWLAVDFDLSPLVTLGEDVTLQATGFDFLAGTATTTVANTVVPDSSMGNVDDVGCDFVREGRMILGDAFTDATGRGIYGRDEGLSCLVTWFGEVATADATISMLWFAEGAEGGVAIAEFDEDTGAKLSSARVSVNDPSLVDSARPSQTLSTRISRNGDYVWAAWMQLDAQGTTPDFEIYASEYLPTRLDGDGNPQPVPPLASTLGAPLSLSDNVVDPYSAGAPMWYEWQDHLGYVCGIQSDPAVMNVFFSTSNLAVLDDMVYHVRLTADVDGTLGGESASPPAEIVRDDAMGIHQDPGQADINETRTTFNAVDAGADGDVLYVFVRDGDGTDGPDEQYLWAGRLGVTSRAPVEIGSRTDHRQVARSFPIALVATPAGRDIGGWDPDSADWDDQAAHGAEWVHVIFRESKVSSLYDVPGSLGSTIDGYGLRTRTFRCPEASASLGDDFVPPAGTGFHVPFDLDLPFVNISGASGPVIHSIFTEEDSVAVIFEELGHLYFQECNPGDGDDGLTGWRQSTPGVSDPALVDDDHAELVYGTELVARPSCACDGFENTVIVWEKYFDVDGYEARLQLRIVKRR
ncbi:MAG: hypothetical protein IT452_13585 [Planctomycetia bacterium]|nr:hypothetical protein [Planctomycetia bacterium]